MDLSQYGFRQDYDHNNRNVIQEPFSLNGKEYFISTVDLGIDHRFGEGTPLYFETMIFREGHSLYCKRYTTRKEALSGHLDILKRINEGGLQLVGGYFEEVDEEENQ